MNFLIFIIVPIIIGLYAQMRISSAYEHNKKILSKSGATGRDAAQAVLDAAGIYDVKIVAINGHLTDHYNPVEKTLALSKENYFGTSLAALGVATHEAGHAIQHKEHYAPLKFRMSLIPITNFASQLLPVVMLLGFFMFHSIMALYVCVAIYMVLALFQLVTLPVEFNASVRAKAQLRSLGFISGSEKKGVDEVLDAAAFTYLAAFISSLGWLFYMLAASRR